MTLDPEIVFARWARRYRPWWEGHDMRSTLTGDAARLAVFSQLIWHPIRGLCRRLLNALS